MGAVAGGTLGGVIGAQSGNTGTGVVLGSLLGALAGAAIGHYGYDQKRTEEEAQQQYNYNYNQSETILVRIEDAFASPTTVSRGGTIELSTTYTILGPQGATMDVTETREIRKGAELTGKPQVTRAEEGGERTRHGFPLTLATNAQTGTYTVQASIQSGSSSDSKDFTFTVK